MRYLCLIYAEERHLAAMSVDELDAFVEEYAVFTAELKAAGHFLGGEPLHPSATARTVRVREGAVSATPGPAVESREQLGGYYLIEARDEEDAVSIAARIPSARMGTIEIRPVREGA